MQTMNDSDPNLPLSQRFRPLPGTGEADREWIDTHLLADLDPDQAVSGELAGVFAAQADWAGFLGAVARQAPYLADLQRRQPKLVLAMSQRPPEQLLRGIFDDIAAPKGR